MQLTKPTRRAMLIGVALSAVTLAVYWPLTGADFISCDDPAYVTLNAHVLRGLSWANAGWAFSTVFYDYYHPLSWLSHMADVTLFGMKPGGHHLTSVLFHIANTLLLFGVLRRMTGAVWRSACVAALFALHPLHVESVAWVTERKDVLSGFFFLLTVWAYARYAGKSKVQSLKSKVQDPEAEGRSREMGGVGEGMGDRGPNDATPDTEHAPRTTQHATRFYALALLCFALALMSKPMVVTLPFVLLLLDYWPLGRWQPAPGGAARPARKFHPSSLILHPLLLEKLPFLALSVAISVVTFVAQANVGVVSSLGSMPLAQRVSTALMGYAGYLRHTFWPAGLAIFYPMPDQWRPEAVLAAGAVVLGITAWVLWRERPYLAVGWFWFLGMLVPVIGLVQSGAQEMADRYTYLPLIGVFVMMVWGVNEACERWEIRNPKSETRKKSEARNPKAPPPQDPPPISARALRPSGFGFRPSFGFRVSGFGFPRFLLAGLVLVACAGLTFRQAGYWHDSETLFQHALGVTQGNYMAENNLAGVFYLQGKMDEAIAHYQASLAAQPRQGRRLEVCYYLGEALSKRGRYGEAAEQFEAVLQAEPKNVGALVELGIARARQGQGPEAERAFAEALRLDPNSAAAHDSFGNVLAQEGRHAEAVRQFEAALRAQPDNAGALNNLAISCRKLGRVGEAMGHYREAIRLQPDSVEALNNLAWLLAASPEAKLRNGTEAVQLATRACELTKYQNPIPLATVAAAYAETGQFRDAISFAEQAQALVGGRNAAVAARLKAMLGEFHAGQAYRGE